MVPCSTENTGACITRVFVVSGEDEELCSFLNKNRKTHAFKCKTARLKPSRSLSPWRNTSGRFYSNPEMAFLQVWMCCTCLCGRIRGRSWRRAAPFAAGSSRIVIRSFQDCAFAATARSFSCVSFVATRGTCSVKHVSVNKLQMCQMIFQIVLPGTGAQVRVESAGSDNDFLNLYITATILDRDSTEGTHRRLMKNTALQLSTALSRIREDPRNNPDRGPGCCCRTVWDLQRQHGR